MIGSIVSSFTKEDDRIVDEYTYQELVCRTLLTRKDAQIIPVTTDARYMQLFSKYEDIKVFSNDRISKQLKASDVIYLAIDRGLTQTMLARSIEAIQANPNIRILFFTLFGNDTLTGQLITAVNKEKFDSEIERLNKMCEYMYPLYVRNKMHFNVTGDLTNYKEPQNYYRFLRNVNSIQEDLIQGVELYYSPKRIENQ